MTVHPSNSFRKTASSFSVRKNASIGTWNIRFLSVSGIFFMFFSLWLSFSVVATNAVGSDEAADAMVLMSAPEKT